MVRLSKLHASSQSVSLCKQRREIIKAAKNCRYSLVTSFELYLESLLELGNSLNNYVEKEFVIEDCCVHLEFSSDSDSDSDLDSLLHHVDEEEPARRFHHILEVEDECNTSEHDNGETEEARSASTSANRSTPKTTGPRFSKKNTQFHMSHEEDFEHHEHIQKMETFENPMFFSHYSDMFVHYGGAVVFPMGVPVTVLPNHDPVSQMHGTKQNNTVNTVLPPPNPPHVSTWDFLHPFSMNYDASYEHDQDERVIREREGIPDLEDEGAESEESFQSTKEVFDQKKKETKAVFYQKKKENGIRLGSGDGTSNATQSSAEKGAFSSKGKELMVWGARVTSEKKKCVMGPKTKVQDTESSETISCRMSLKEAVVDIRNQFKHLVDCGKEFSSVIEVGKRQHHSASSKFKGFASCVLGLIYPSANRCLHPSYMPYQPAPKSRLFPKSDMKSNQYHVTSSDLLSTLEKLHVWEDKLYIEVKGEEKLGILYDKQSKRLKEMDDRGFGSDEIDEALASFKLLHSQIKVAVTSISAKSREIHELRDNKLLPELNKLIEGLTRLWKVMSTCHQKQFKAIQNAKSHVHILDPENMKKSSTKSTLRLEKVILNWGKCFRNFINTQKTLVKHLNNWLLRFILEAAENGTSPLLPSDAPPIFKVCKNWYQAIDKISETGVSEAISNFASSLHQLYVKLKEEKALKAKVKKLVKNYQYQLKTICEENGINTKEYDSFIKMKASEAFRLDDIPILSASHEDLAISRERLVEQRKRHHEVFMHVNDVASSCLNEGLTPIFDALQSFCLENLKAYKQLRIPSSSSGTNE